MASSTSSIGWFLWVMAALLTTMSTEPNFSWQTRPTLSMSARLDTSAFTASAAAPTSASTRSAASLLMSAMTTFAPSLAYSLTMPSPKPLPPPVTIAILPCN
ncbi:hypothetical protein G6F24_017789 [Rhizopus arrhizus]|nr:hypothetical protein G6F24_017789 [Rhizopus arrhizus]